LNVIDFFSYLILINNVKVFFQSSESVAPQLDVLLPRMDAVEGVRTTGSADGTGVAKKNGL
jgi:hypothetical protein